MIIGPNVPSGVVFKLVFVSVSRLRESAVIGCLKDDGNEDMIRRKYTAVNIICVYRESILPDVLFDIVKMSIIERFAEKNYNSDKACNNLQRNSLMNNNYHRSKMLHIF